MIEKIKNKAIESGIVVTIYDILRVSPGAAGIIIRLINGYKGANLPGNFSPTIKEIMEKKEDVAALEVLRKKYDTVALEDIFHKYRCCQPISPEEIAIAEFIDWANRRALGILPIFKDLFKIRHYWEQWFADFHGLNLQEHSEWIKTFSKQAVYIQCITNLSCEHLNFSRLKQLSD